MGSIGIFIDRLITIFVMSAFLKFDICWEANEWKNTGNGVMPYLVK